MALTNEAVRDHLARTLDFVRARSRVHDGGESEAVANALHRLVATTDFQKLVNEEHDKLASPAPAQPEPPRG
jgi:hypothetical protein